MTDNIVVLLMMYFPFYFSLTRSYCSWITRVVLLFWCGLMSTLVLLVKEATDSNLAHGVDTTTYGIILVSTIIFMCVYLGNRVVLSDKPKT